MRIELKIDGVKVKINQKANIAVTHSIADVQEPDNTSAGYSKSVEVPLIPDNMRVFRFTNELYSKEQFNNELHTAEYIVDGNIVMSGVAQIDKITYKFGAGRKLIGGSFHVSVIGAAFEWITNAKRQMNELTSDETVKYAMQEVYDNSTRPDVSLVKFFPVDRGAFWEEVNDVKVPRTSLEIRDYHPFFNVWKALGLIFGDYTVKSSIRGLFESLYCSGYIPEQEDLSYIKEENDFYIGTSAVDAAVNIGAISSTNPSISWDVYNLFESEDYHYKEGVIIKNNIPEGRYTAFKPTETAIVKLETNLHFVSKIMNGSADGTWLDRLDTPGECFYVNTFQQVVGGNIETLTLTLDKCEEAKNGKIEGEVAIRGDATKAKTFVVYFEIAQELKKNTRVYFYHAGVYSCIGQMKKGKNWYIVNTYKSKNTGFFYVGSTAYPSVDREDVAGFYYFEIQDNEVTFKIENATKNAYALQKGVTYPIYGIFSCSQKYGFSPKDANVTLMLCANNNIKPTFPNIIGLNEPVSISVIGGTNSQLDYIAALRQMFNLMFYTNPLTKEVFIEPRTRFYNFERSDIVDWRGKIDYSQEVEIEELGGDIGKSLKLAYADGNEVVQYYNWKNRTELGVYSTSLLNKTADDTKEVVNTTFSPFLLRTVDSVGMTIPQEKREKTQDDINDVDLDITPMVGYFDGVTDRTAGTDRNIYPKYPRLVFQDAARGINLGFADITAQTVVPGLRQYYEDNISAYNVGRRVTMYLKLMPQDVEAIQFPNRLMRDFRAVFLLNIDGEDVPCLLESIEDYNPASGASTKCVFISDPNLKLTGDDLTVITYDDVAVGRNNTLIGYR